MKKKINLLIIGLLTLGILYRLMLTWDGNFLFNMDNARDMVDVREMVEQSKLRLTGPTSAIEGFFNGPFWYYLLAIPYIATGGNPYGSILMEIALWAIGGFFLLKLARSFGIWPTIVAGSLWVASDYVVLTNLYAFNPNPVILLTPLFIYLFFKYLETNKLIFSIFTFFLGGLFFNFEMNFGVFIPPIILVTLFLTKKIQYLKSKNFWVGAIFFIICLLPQVMFDLRHDFLMTNSLMNYLSQGQTSYNFGVRLQSITLSFYNVFSATLMNHKTFTLIILALFLSLLSRFLKEKDKNPIVLISSSLIFVPFISYLFIPVTVNAWHLGAPAAASIVLIGFLLNKTKFGILIGFFIVFFAISNIFKFFIQDFGKPSGDPSLFKNEVKAIDYVYQKAEGNNFKVYTYLPSAYDYPYQYLFWWYGGKIYGYIPGEYVYSPNKPRYIPSQDKFQGSKDNFSGLVFLIKEPDRIKMRQAWENDFKDMEFISKKMVGPLEIEIRMEKIQL